MLTSEGAHAVDQDKMVANASFSAVSSVSGSISDEPMSDSDVELDVEEIEEEEDEEEEEEEGEYLSKMADDVTHWSEAQFEERCTYVVKDTAVGSEVTTQSRRSDAAPESGVQVQSGRQRGTNAQREHNDSYNCRKEQLLNVVFIRKVVKVCATYANRSSTHIPRLTVSGASLSHLVRNRVQKLHFSCCYSRRCIYNR
ncbi:hypothetical protein WMY93_030586 [Mugilogobius chulae]|uniref:Uncharacterized protein n=1 Tax=Mugilogobius chulae TaxID=88201 RepID=A0AAW0ML09_9GOBI